ncbi:tRNA (5-methylaminomethyl-2-thiouridine)(34)-methyltransferase MnmD [Croceivirga radicis]|uniref:tRNA (5-methylaminomethyl-2-thiouridine)(34)-methyltransferase MnmD n=1 Tax=Croceivirga radicis TaxID=1929488 RepID=UPI000255AD40|nr:tRNA (5-methylaminomethyl-2-thiouridine)(34)-methyltransferase MnmD [Croceivirga radicis]
MKRKVVTTADGSATIHLEEWNEQYHSKHGAIQEAEHVFLKHGLHQFEKNAKIAILEIGFGTGLNALLTIRETLHLGYTIRYTGIEAFPVAQEEIAQLNYVQLLHKPELEAVFKKMHSIDWGVPENLIAQFSLEKVQINFQEITYQDKFDLVYFDAFGARVQPELWTEEIFQKMFNALRSNGILVTYAAKGSVRRAMQAVGFKVERLPGPPGKREMLRAVKP